MSSTRKSKDDSTFYQARWASSAEFERGLLANLVAKRCALIDSAADRELIWFIQYLSHQDGGLAGAARETIAKYPEKIQTAEMLAMHLKHDQTCTAAQVKKIKEGMPFEESAQYPLRGEFSGNELLEVCNGDEIENRKADGRPTSYPASAFRFSCHLAANAQLEKHLAGLCLNPESSLKYGPWYFPSLIETLHEYKAEFTRIKSAGAVVTALGKIIYDTLDYTAYCRGLTLMQGEARTGKSHAARAWCEQRPGLARFIEVPPSNDEISFFRALSRGLGLGSFLNYKMGEIRDRVESVLLTGNLVLVLDESQRLWPQKNYRYGFPSRIIWVMTMANAGVPIAMVSTPQFIQTQKAVEKTGWNSAQLTGRISHYESLPPNLSAEDLMAVAKAALPEVGADVLEVLATYAQTSARNLAAIDSISKRARYIASRAGRAAATTGDVRTALKESVIPADSKLHDALASGKAPRSTEMRAPIPAAPAEMDAAAAEDSTPVATTARRGSSPVRLQTESPARQRGGIEAVLTAI
jgi:hypothetical protein